MTRRLVAGLILACILGVSGTNAWTRPTVAVLDTGCSIDSVDGVSFTRTSPFIDSSGHGTLMTKVILDANPNVHLVMVKVAESSADFKPHIIARGLAWCLENNVDIVNLSFTIDEDDEVRNAIYKLISRGITVVAAVGNRCTSTGFVVRNGLVYRASSLNTTGFPANMSSVIGVGALDFWGNLAGFARTAGDVAVDGTWWFEKGTSISSARLSGYISLILEKYPHLSTSGIKKVILSLAERKQNNLLLSKKTVNTALHGNGVAQLVESDYQLAMNR